VSPSKARIAFAGATDPCATGDAAAKPSLYVGDAKTGAYKHVLTADSRFRARWIDDDRLIYEDGSGGAADLRRRGRARGRQARRARRAGPRHAAADRGAAVPQRADRRRSRRGRRAAARAVRPAGQGAATEPATTP
jgi:hypothetical protein